MIHNCIQRAFGKAGMTFPPILPFPTTFLSDICDSLGLPYYRVGGPQGAIGKANAETPVIAIVKFMDGIDHSIYFDGVEEMPNFGDDLCGLIVLGEYNEMD
jgi:hypothetical protein